MGDPEENSGTKNPERQTPVRVYEEKRTLDHGDDKSVERGVTVADVNEDLELPLPNGSSEQSKPEKTRVPSGPDNIPPGTPLPSEHALVVCFHFETVIDIYIVETKEPPHRLARCKKGRGPLTRVPPIGGRASGDRPLAGVAIIVVEVWRGELGRDHDTV